MIKITTHSIVKNEDQWIWYSLMAIKDLVSEMLVVDDGSQDNTAKIVSGINDPKIRITKKQLLTSGDHTKTRNEMITETKTEWFIILDGDEVWDKGTFNRFLNYIETLDKNIYAVAMRTRNCVGDVWHYLPEDAGKYEILGRKGHFTTRAFRKLSGFSWQGTYPLEYYADSQGASVGKQTEHLAFFDDHYWHMTHLLRSTSKERVKGWRKTKMETGIMVNKDELPEILFKDHPTDVPDPLKKRSIFFEMAATVVTPIKKLRRKFQ